MNLVMKNCCFLVSDYGMAHNLKHDRSVPVKRGADDDEEEDPVERMIKKTGQSQLIL